MRSFLTVLKFELMSFFKNKAFVLSTVIICLMLVIGLSIPTIIDVFKSSDKEEQEELVEEQDPEDIAEYGYINKGNAIDNIEDLESSLYGGKLIEFEDEKELEKKVNSEEIKVGYIIESPTKYQYIVKNNEMIDMDRSFFEDALLRAYKINEFKERGIEYQEIEDILLTGVEYETKILGKDSVSNYSYTYILIFALYFVIILYGQLIATSVASEKSNRAMEVLITSTSSNNLIFGKVIGGALAGAIQFALFILTAGISYKLNATAWDGGLDFVFKIPGSVLLIFSVFGILGYLFYAFIYGALGALVSRTEDINSVATPVMFLYIGAFFISIMGMNMPDSLMLKIASYVPFSSFMAMFVRISMGTVSTLQVIISLIILAISTGLIGLLASAIYRMGTLMYGNPVKIRKVIKLLREK